MKNRSSLLVFGFAVLIASCIKPSSEPAPVDPTLVVKSSVSYYNDLIVFNFAEEYTTGQFANGDYWVHNNGGDVIITSITPASETVSGRTINGTMINPSMSGQMGYDSSPRDMEYVASLNVDPGITGNSLEVQPGSSVIKSISMQSDEGRPIISDAAVLTVLAESPPEGAFRPPYIGTDRTILANVSDLNYDALGRHPKLGGEPIISEVSQRYERVWLEHNEVWTQRDIHPQNNMPTYGRDIALSSGVGLILLQLDYTNEEKEELLIRLVQYGLDIYSTVKQGTNWYNSGGHNQGRKMPLLLAGKVLGNPDILAYADKEQHFVFQDDQQCFYVSQAEVDMTHSSEWNPDDRAAPIPYEASDIGLPEWGIHHYDEPESDNKNWDAPYRITNGQSQVLHAFAAMLMGVEDDWNWPPKFDYSKRFYEIEKARFSDYVVALWDTYITD